MQSEIFVLYHASCPDGFGSAYAAWRVWGDEAQYLPVSYGQPPPSLPPGSLVYIVDFSFPQDTLLQLAALHRHVWLIDHHQSAQQDLGSLQDAIPTLTVQFDLEHSGAWLTWTHFHALQPVPALIDLIQDRDLWRFALSDSREINVAIHSYPQTFEAWDALCGALETTDGRDRLVQEGRAIQRYTEQLVARMCGDVQYTVLGGHRVPVVNATVLVSEVGSQLCARSPEAPFSASYSEKSNGQRQWALRSRHGFDVSAVARQYGGGGHPAAAGFLSAHYWFGDRTDGSSPD